MQDGIRQLMLAIALEAWWANSTYRSFLTREMAIDALVDDAQAMDTDLWGSMMKKGGEVW